MASKSGAKNEEYPNPYGGTMYTIYSNPKRWFHQQNIKMSTSGRLSGHSQTINSDHLPSPLKLWSNMLQLCSKHLKTIWATRPLTTICSCRSYSQRPKDTWSSRLCSLVQSFVQDKWLKFTDGFSTSSAKISNAISWSYMELPHPAS